MHADNSQALQGYHKRLIIAPWTRISTHTQMATNLLVLLWQCTLTGHYGVQSQQVINDGSVSQSIIHAHVHCLAHPTTPNPVQHSLHSAPSSHASQQFRVVEVILMEVVHNPSALPIPLATMEDMNTHVLGDYNYKLNISNW